MNARLRATRPLGGVAGRRRLPNLFPFFSLLALLTALATPAFAVGTLLDSGTKKYKELEKDTRDQKTGFKKGWSALTGKGGDHDKNGHGTLVASIASNSKRNSLGKYHGVAPDSTVIPIQVLGEEGPDHKKEFTIAAVVGGAQVAVARGRNKRQAEQRAARAAMVRLRDAVEGRAELPPGLSRNEPSESTSGEVPGVDDP